MIEIDDTNRPRSPLDFDEKTFIKDYEVTYAILCTETDKTIARINEIRNTR